MYTAISAEEINGNFIPAILPTKIEIVRKRNGVAAQPANVLQ